MKKNELPEMPYWDGPLSHPFYSKVVKRALDLLLALILLVPGLILMIPLAVWVRLDSEGPVIYKAVRGGYHNQPFMIWKFRSMVVDADKTGGCTAKNDARVTRAGRIMRYTTQYTEEQQCIMWVRPGVTDRSSIVYIAQDEIVGEEDPVANFEKLILPEKNRLRVEYAKTQCFRLDVKLMLETVAGVFRKVRS